MVTKTILIDLVVYLDLSRLGPSVLGVYPEIQGFSKMLDTLAQIPYFTPYNYNRQI